MQKNEILQILLKEESSLKLAIAQCEIAKMNGNMQLANKWFAVAADMSSVDEDAILHLEGEMDYYGLLHVGVNVENEIFSVCCPIPKLNKAWYEFCETLPRKERQIHARKLETDVFQNIEVSPEMEVWFQEAGKNVFGDHYRTILKKV
mgnify:FL=1